MEWVEDLILFWMGMGENQGVDDDGLSNGMGREILLGCK
jgi:hypothetical protein